MFHPFKGTIINLYIVTSSRILISRHDHVLSFSASTSSPISLLATTKASVFFFFIVCTLLPNILSAACSPITWTRAGSSLQFVTSDLQTLYHNLSFRFLSLYSSNFLLYKGGGLSTSHINFSTSSTTDIAIWHKAQGLCLTAASKQLFSSQCARTDWNMCILSLSATFCCLENVSCSSNFSVATTEKLPVRALV